MTRPLPLLLLLVAMVCASTAGAPPDTDVAAVAGGITAFSSDLYAKLSERPGNLFCSPFSISTALAMTYAGARGATAEQMARVLHFGLGQDALHPASGALAARLTGGDLPGCELSVANRIWAQPSTGLLPAFLEATRRHYRAEVARADFSARTEAARTEINRWVEKQTKDRIKDLIAKGLLSRDTRMVLVNAIYFKGRWAVQFEKDSTRDAPFTIGDGQAVSAPMMHRSGELRYVEVEVAVVELRRHVRLDQRLQHRDVEHVAGRGVHRPLHRHLEVVVVAVVVRVGARPEDPGVLGVRPRRVVAARRRVEMRAARHADGGGHPAPGRWRRRGRGASL